MTPAETEILERLRKSKAVAAYFSTPTCNVCKVLRPKVEGMVRQTGGIEFVYVDSEQYPAAAGQHMVFAVPTIILFMDGREMRRYSRNLALDDLERSLGLMNPEH
ncbi:MAG: thioredoxin [Ignavibacteria bacterium]|nr:MAG: thioredoxin [Ignavibacteria bacterium]